MFRCQSNESSDEAVNCKLRVSDTYLQRKSYIHYGVRR